MKRRVWLAIMLLLAVGCMQSGACAEGGNPLPPEQASCEAAQDTRLNIEEGGLCGYMAAVKAEAARLEDALANDAWTQTDMNLVSKAICDLWDEALRTLMDEAARRLPEAEWAKLMEEQRVWASQMEMAVKEAAKEAEGGSVYPLIVNGERARLTQVRACALYELLEGTHAP